MGTIGGNIANGSPIGDTPPPFIALGAKLHLRQGEHRREIKLEDYFVAYGKQDRQPGEFVESVTLPLLPAGEKFATYKISKRREEDISALCGAFRVFVNDAGHGGHGAHRLWRHGGNAQARQGGRGGAGWQAVDDGDDRGGAGGLCRGFPADHRYARRRNIGC